MIYFINSENYKNIAQPAIARIFNDKVRNWGTPNCCLLHIVNIFYQPHSVQSVSPYVQLVHNFLLA